MRSQPLLTLLATPYVFHRLEPVTERLATEQLPAVLDADLKTWYLNRTATILAPHLLEFYRRQVEEALTTQGLDALAPPARSLLQVSTRIGKTNALLPPPPCGSRRVTAAAKWCIPHVSSAFPRQLFCLYTEQMSSIFAGNFLHFRSLPAVRGGSYGASGGHLRTSGSQQHGALPRDRGAPGDLSRLVA